jgi:hypothetical protein
MKGEQIEMNKTKLVEDTGTRLAVDITGLAQMLGSGKQTAREVGEAAGASFKIGRRRLYHVPKIEAYLDTLTK